ncbi:M50 family metallopeptidase [Oceanobacillus halophilus]|uniref:Stage IV sporulation protein FB n=1 Tax=Oceanobacillus halophilus TaxID=930130 RepID=A0A495AD54_9BACI|nr:M50 family metallopeptidase [Oceanobacillus halophilus]RKQ37909.1 stage IV sporulation protein FB [Oceanobacillus halophilus]
MNSSNLLPKIQLHPVLLIFIIISFITGTFIELSIILSIVFIHEVGHYMMARHYNWRIRSIMFWVFGGVLDTDEHGNRPIKEEALVTIAGPFQHVIIHLLLFFLSLTNLIPNSMLDLAFHYNSVILLFNLLPIWPLDGGKLYLLILSKYVPYKKAHQTVIVSSVFLSILFIILQLTIFSFTLSTILIMMFLLLENRTEWKQRYYVFIRFLLNRYEGVSHVKRVHPINVSSDSTFMELFSNFRRESKHPIYIHYPGQTGRIAIDENDCLHSFFNRREHTHTIGEVFISR